MIRSLALVLVASLAVVPAVAAQTTEARFPITAVGDSTFTFAAGKATWIKRNMRGIVVDPQRQDALVGRFQILSVTRGQVRAVITAEAADIATTHVALMEQPTQRLFVRRDFWLGALLGLVVGAAAGAAF